MDQKRGWMTSGAFAAFCGTTKETLRHYKEIGLLTPAYRGENGYFYYDPEQFYDFYAISLFRMTGTPLEESHRWFHPAGAPFSAPEMIVGTYIGHEGVPSLLTVEEKDGRILRTRDGAVTELTYCGGARFLAHKMDGPEDQGVRHEFLIRDGRAWGVRCGTRVFERMA